MQPASRSGNERGECGQGLKTAKWCGLDLANRPAFGEALDADKLERLDRYEVHLDRKLERMLAMLLRLKELPQGAIEG
jgi:hypothetical protein